MMLTAAQAKLLVSNADPENPEEKWKPLFLQIEATARRGHSWIDCMNLNISPDIKPEEIRGLIMALGYKWKEESNGYFEISWY